MPIEVKQLIIKSTVTDEHRDRDNPGLASEEFEALKQQLLEECKALIEQSLEKSRER